MHRIKSLCSASCGLAVAKVYLSESECAFQRVSYSLIAYEYADLVYVNMIASKISNCIMRTTVCMQRRNLN